MMEKLWEPVKVKRDVTYACKIGGKAILIKHSLKDLYLATEDADEASADMALKPRRGREPAAWSRWTSGEEDAVVQLLPALPDKPVVVRPEASIKVPANQEAFFFVGIPLWLRITAGSGQAITLCEVPTEVLSKTWFGDTVSGELGYALKSRAMRNLSQVESRAGRATCPVLIKNTSNLGLDFQRLCLHVENLGLFKSDKRIWTNQVNVLYRGEEKAGQISFSEKPPDLEGESERISEPRVKSDKSLLRKSFQAMKILTGLEGI